MADIIPILATFMMVLWPILTGICIWKYRTAFRERKRLDTWIWFGAFCVCLTALEWWVLSVMILGKIFFGL